MLLLVVRHIQVLRTQLIIVYLILNYVQGGQAGIFLGCVAVGAEAIGNAIGDIINNSVPDANDKDDNEKGEEGGEAGEKSDSASGNLPDLSGKSKEEAEKELKKAGFEKKGTTKGGYEEYRHPDGSRVWVRPDGEIIRLGPKVQNPDPNKKGHRPRINPNGNVTDSHNTGEILR